MVDADLSNKVKQMLAAAQDGSQDAIGEAFEACRAYLTLIAERELDPALRAKGGASDLVQETFLEAHRDFHRFHGATEEELVAWLRRVLLHNVADFARRYRDTAKRDMGREVELEAGPAQSKDLGGNFATPSRYAIGQETAVALDAALARLPDEYRQVILYRYRDERSFQEIGQLMNRSATAARKFWSRAVERLQQELDRRD